MVVVSVYFAIDSVLLLFFSFHICWQDEELARSLEISTGEIWIYFVVAGTPCIIDLRRADSNGICTEFYANFPFHLC